MTSCCRSWPRTFATTTSASAWPWSTCSSRVGRSLPRLAPELEALLTARDDGVARHAAFLLGKMGPEAIPRLLGALHRPESRIDPIAEALAQIGRPAARALMQAAKDPEPRVRRGCGAGAGRDPPAGPRHRPGPRGGPGRPRSRGPGGLPHRHRPARPASRRIRPGGAGPAQRPIRGGPDPGHRRPLAIRAPRRAPWSATSRRCSTTPMRGCSAGRSTAARFPRPARPQGAARRHREAGQHAAPMSASPPSSSSGVTARPRPRPSPRSPRCWTTRRRGSGWSPRRRWGAWEGRRSPRSPDWSRCWGPQQADVREAAVAAMGSLELDAEVIRPHLAKALRDDKAEVRRAATPGHPAARSPGGHPDPGHHPAGRSQGERPVGRATAATVRAAMARTRGRCRSWSSCSSTSSRRVRLLAIKFLGLAGRSAGDAIPALERMRERSRRRSPQAGAGRLRTDQEPA